MNPSIRKSIVSRAAILLALTFALGMFLASSATAQTANQDESTRSFDLPEGDARPMLRQFSDQAKREIVFDVNEVSGITTKAVKGDYSVREALDHMLANTGLVATVDAKTGAIAVRKGEARPNVQGVALETGSHPLPESKETASNEPVTMNDFIVTAEKREEVLQDVPVPVTAISGATLISENTPRMLDYFQTIPGLSAFSSGSGITGGFGVVIRGMNSTGGNATVATIVDDVSYDSPAFGSLPDIDPCDISNIEVLRGPQGTLYGASSIGGLIKYVTIDPSTAGFSGFISGGISEVTGGQVLGYNLRGALNIPVSNTLAIRISGFNRFDPGYIDDVEDGDKGINWRGTWGGRISALWKPSVNLSVKVSALVQTSKLHGLPEVDSGLGDLEQSTLPNTGWNNQDVQAYSAIVKYRIGDGEITAVTGYNMFKWSTAYDFTWALGGLSGSVFGTPGSTLGTPLFTEYDDKTFSQELRLSESIGKHLDLLLGALYVHSTSASDQQLYALNSDGSTAGVWLSKEPTWETYAEYAGFADLTYHFTDKFDVQVGGRVSDDKQSWGNSYFGPYATILLGIPSPAVNPRVYTSDSSFTYLFAPEYKVSSNLMVYARLTSGYRAGGPNVNNTTSGQGILPLAFKPDTTKNYEIGAKGNLLNKKLIFDASLYYVDWRDIQLGFTNPINFAGYTGNGGAAKSEGAELSVELRPWKGLSIEAWAALNEAVLTEELPALTGISAGSGTRLPLSPKFSDHISVRQEFDLSRDLTAYVGAAYSYTGARVTSFAYTGQQVPLPAFSTVDATAGIRHGRWVFGAFATNLQNTRGQLGVDLNPSYYYFITPRTIGLNATLSF